MKKVGMRRGARALVLGGIVGVLTLGSAAQASASVCVPPTPVFAGGNYSQSSTNTTVSAPVSAVSIGETVVASVMTGTAAGNVSCSDTRGNFYAVFEKNTGNGRLFVCTSKVTTALAIYDEVTATYPQFSGISVIDVVTIPNVALPVASSTNSGSNPPVTTPAVPVNGTLLFGVVSNTNTAVFSPTNGFTALTNFAFGSGAARRNVTPVWKYVSGGSPVGLTGNMLGSGFWQAAIIAYPVNGCQVCAEHASLTRFFGGRPSGRPPTRVLDARSELNAPLGSGRGPVVGTLSAVPRSRRRVLHDLPPIRWKFCGVGPMAGYEANRRVRDGPGNL